jgi:cell wall-associated NlpC family hydrolase
MSDITITVNPDSPLYNLALYVQKLEQEQEASKGTESLLRSQLAATIEQVENLNALLADANAKLYDLTTPAWKKAADRVIRMALALVDENAASGYTKYPYDFGGNPKLDSAGNLIGGTFDCSSFTKYLFGKEGIILPRTSLSQSSTGTLVAYSDLRPLDRIHFDTDKDGKVNHVGIYMGNGQMVHSNPSGKGPNVVALAGYWESRFVNARRDIG